MSHGQVEAETDDKVRCDACPVTCYIRRGMAGACDRYANRDGKLVRVDPHVLLERTMERGGSVVPFSRNASEWAGAIAARGFRVRDRDRGWHDLSRLSARRPSSSRPRSTASTWSPS